MWRLLVLATLTVVNAKLTQLFSWDSLDYSYTSRNYRSYDIEREDFIEKNNLPTGMSIWENKMFITVPRWRRGVVSTLNYIALDEDKNNKSPVLHPYPSWKSHNLNAYNPDGLISVLHARPDTCNRLWVIDIGVVGMLKGEGQRVIRNPRIVVFDLKTDKIIHEFDLSNSRSKPDSFFSDFTVDVEGGNCSDAHVYIADPIGTSIIVYSLRKNKSWIFSNVIMSYEPLEGFYQIEGTEETEELDSGVQSLTIVRTASGVNLLYFHAVSSKSVYAVPIDLLKNEVYAQRGLKGEKYFYVGSKGENTQALTAFLDSKRQILYYPLVNRHAIACWDINKPLDETNFKLVERNDKNLTFVSDMVIDEANDRFYALNSNFLKFKGYPDLKNDKFVVHTAPLSYLYEKCKTGPQVALREETPKIFVQQLRRHLQK